jgi:polysaccharide chain length determinant protein (PEP-CTERM system associated)
MLPGKQYTPVDYALIAWRRRWTVVIPTLVCLYAAIVVSSMIKDIYRSEMLIQVIPQRVPDSYVQSTVTMRTGERIAALSQQVMSRTALERIIQDMNLYPEDRLLKPMQDVVEKMRDNISVDPVASVQSKRGDTDAFYVRFTYPDRTLATRVTEKLGGLFVDLNARDRGELAEATSKFLDSQLADTRGRLEQQERRLEQFRERNAGRLPTQLAFNMQAIQNTQLAVQALVESLARDRDRKMMLERIYNDTQAELDLPVALPMPPPGVSRTGDEPAGLTPAQQLVAARELLARLELRLKPEHPDIARTKRLISELETRVAGGQAEGTKEPPVPATPTQEQTVRKERLAQMRAEMESLDRQIGFKEAEEQKQRATLAQYQRRIEEVPSVESEWTSLTRDYDTQLAAYKDLLAKSEQSKIAVELERRQIGEQFRVLDPARPPVRPIGLRRLQVNAIGAAVGVLIGVLLAGLRELGDTTFKTDRDIIEVVALPVLAAVPYVVTASDRRLARRQRWLTTAVVATILMAAGSFAWALQLWRFLI